MISIDGEVHHSEYYVKYGESFPVSGRSKECYIETVGKCLIYIIWTGSPEWTDKLSIKVPIRYYLTQIKEPCESYQKEKRKEEIGLRLIKDQ